MGRNRGERKQKPLLLWLDFSFTPQDREPRVIAARRFRIACTTRPDKALEDVTNFAPVALCFEFDHVDALRAQVLHDVVAAHVRIPALMLTVEHSEAAAVWAFRAGVWNYLVKPVPADEFASNLERLESVGLRGALLRTPRPPGVHAPCAAVATPADIRIARLEPALRYVRRHYADKVSEMEVARRCGMNRFAFSHAFHAVFGLTFRNFLTETRIAEARRLLSEGGLSITEVAFATGFTDGSHFARMFRQHTGRLPSQCAGDGPASFPAP